ncbi:MAG: hypothetical protein J6X44_05105, partial [Thermoguttaceae bacterium]|nr:hypothetical protein [Thermoguttaceae bacterium]
RAQTKYEIAPTHENLLNHIRLDGKILVSGSDDVRRARTRATPLEAHAGRRFVLKSPIPDRTSKRDARNANVPFVSQRRRTAVAYALFRRAVDNASTLS